MLFLAIVAPGSWFSFGVEIFSSWNLAILTLSEAEYVFSLTLFIPVSQSEWTNKLLEIAQSARRRTGYNQSGEDYMQQFRDKYSHIIILLDNDKTSPLASRTRLCINIFIIRDSRGRVYTLFVTLGNKAACHKRKHLTPSRRHYYSQLHPQTPCPYREGILTKEWVIPVELRG